MRFADLKLKAFCALEAGGGRSRDIALQGKRRFGWERVRQLVSLFGRQARNLVRAYWLVIMLVPCVACPATAANEKADRGAAQEAASSVVIVYPDLAEPYRSIFAEIIRGIEDRARTPLRSFAVAPSADIGELHALLKRDGVKVVIALGRQGLKAAGGLQRDMAVVVGGILAPPDAESRKLSGVSLTPDPALLFARLKNLMPGVRRVIVVYDPQQNEWLIKLAHDAARSHGLELLAQEAPDLKTAARLYETAFTAIDGRRDALWLPQDATTVDEATVLPLVLRESWNRGVAIFSSSILHVKKGALFALYPDNFELGRTLGSSALSALAGDARRGMTPLRELRTAVNLRTAGHIGLNIDYQQQRSFDSVFPEP